MNKNTEVYYKSGLYWHLPVRRVMDIDGFDVKLGKKRYFFRGTLTPFNDCSSESVSLSKYCTNRILKDAGIPVPKSIGIHQTEFESGVWKQRMQALTFPVVLKPTSYRRGIDVLCNIQSMEALEHYIPPYFEKHEFVTIEEFYGNMNSYRVLVFMGKVIGVVLRYPAYVIGDGVNTLETLIALTNQVRQETSDMLSPIVVDEEIRIRLKELNLTLNSIPAKDEWVTLGYTSNAKRGGSFCSLGNALCKENKKLAIRAAKALNLNLVGFDIQCPDINLPMEKTNGVFIEANFNPSIRIHEQPVSGPSLKVSRIIMRQLIYRHPIAYFLQLFENRRTFFYARTALALIVTGLFFGVFARL